MPNFVSYTIKDGSSTPADVSYVPETLSPASTLLLDRRLASRNQNPSIKFDFSPANADRPKTYRVRRFYTTPVVQTVNGVVTVVDNCKTEVIHHLPVSASLQDRKNHAAMVANSEVSASAKAMIENLESWW